MTCMIASRARYIKGLSLSSEPKLITKQSGLVGMFDITLESSTIPLVLLMYVQYFWIYLLLHPLGGISKVLVRIRILLLTFKMFFPPN